MSVNSSEARRRYENRRSMAQNGGLTNPQLNRARKVKKVVEIDQFNRDQQLKSVLTSMAHDDERVLDIPAQPLPNEASGLEVLIKQFVVQLQEHLKSERKTPPETLNTTKQELPTTSRFYTTSNCNRSTIAEHPETGSVQSKKASGTVPPREWNHPDEEDLVLPDDASDVEAKVLKNHHTQGFGLRDNIYSHGSQKNNLCPYKSVLENEYSEESYVDVKDNIYSDYDFPPFDIHKQTGHTRYYALFPEPWNKGPKSDNHTDSRDYSAMLQSVNKRLIEPFDEKNAGDYARWRSAVISFIHLADCPLQAKITAVTALLSERVKDRLEVSIEYSPEGYLDLIRALEEKYGGPKRLLKAAISDLKSLEAMKPDRICDLEKYIKTVGTFFRRLREANLGREINTMTTFQDLISPWPWQYQKEFTMWINQHHRQETPELALAWAKGRLQTLRKIQKPDLSKTERTTNPTTRLFTTIQDNSEADEESIILDEQWTMLGRSNGKRGQEKGCALCRITTHETIDCTFLPLTPLLVRRRLFSALKLCFLCGSPNHFGARCPSGKSCGICSGQHHELLHEQGKSEPQNSFKANLRSDHGKIALKTITVGLQNPQTGCKVIGNCLLDSGNQRHMISKSCAERLGLKGYKNPLHIRGVGGLELTAEALISEVKIMSLTENTAKTIPVRVISDPAGNFRVTNWDQMKQDCDLMKNIPFTPQAGEGKIDIIIGCESPYLLTHLEERWSEEDQLTCARTPLGWTAYGQVPGKSNHSEECMLLIDTFQPKSPIEWYQNQTFSTPSPSGSGPVQPFKGTTIVPTNCNANCMLVTSVDKGNLGLSEEETVSGSYQHPPLTDSDSLSKLVRTCLWEVKETGEDLMLSAEERYALNKMKSSRKKIDGHFEIAALWRKNCPNLENNAEMALARLKGLDRLKSFTQENRDKYEAVFEDWMSQGFIEELPVHKLRETHSWLLPHFPVFKEGGKMRPVMDGAAQFKGQSLNSQCLSGPNMLKSLVTILLRFRRKPVCLSTDVKDMFLQIRLDEESKRYHRFIWKNRNGPLRLFQFLVHTFGNTGSPAVAVFNISAVAEENFKDHPEAAETILESTLMDDSMDSYDDEITAIRAVKDLQYLFGIAGMHAHKFLSNKANVLKTIKMEDRAKNKSLEPQGSPTELPDVRVLGLKYSSSLDEFYFEPFQPTHSTWSKRKILSTFPRIFDPLGFIQPFQLLAKYIIQELTMLKLGWDDPIPPKQLQSWLEWLDGLKNLAEIRVPRCTMKGNTISTDQIHIFVDASEIGYCAVSYRTTFSGTSEKGHSTFLMSKCKVAPLKTLSVPRLELLAAELGLQICSELKKVHKLPEKQYHFWSDSTDVLFWLKTETRRLKRFVGHRVAKIQDLSMIENWNYVPSSENPADIGSRGSSATELTKNDLWWHGPPRLVCALNPPRERDQSLNISETARKEFKDQELILGPETTQDSGITLIPQTTSVFKSEITEVPALQLLPSDRLHPSNFSKLNRFLRVLAWIRRIRSSGCKGPQLTAEEIQEAELIFLRFIQWEALGNQIEALKRKGRLMYNDKLTPLRPFLDAQGVMRAGGRLEYSKKVPRPMRTPIIIPPNYAGRLVMGKIHDTQKHMVGRDSLLATFGENYVMLGSRTLAQRVCSECLMCRRIAAKPMKVPVAPLPEDRIGRIKVREAMFRTAQMDVAGHYFVRNGRKKQPEKRWILVFSCMIYKACHIEVIHSLETSSILLGLQRMMDRRGRIEKVYCDNAKSFTGSNHVLTTLKDILDLGKCEQKYPFLEWDFGPPKEPHYQGLVETEIKSIKRALKAVLTPTRMSDEDFLTFTCTVETILNQRPLTYVSPKLEPLAVRPSDFLGVNGLFHAFPQPFTHHGRDHLSLAKRWLQVNRLLDSWWRRFIKEWLSCSHQRRKRIPGSPPLKVGDVVLYLEENGTRGKFPLARVLKVYPSVDGNVRQVDIEMDKKTYRRAVTKLALLTDH